MTDNPFSSTRGGSPPGDENAPLVGTVAGDSQMLGGAGRGQGWKKMTARRTRGGDDREDSPTHRNSWNIIIGWLKYTFGPAILYMSVSILFMVGYHQNPRLLLVLAALLILALLGDAFFIYSAKSRMTVKVLGFSVCAFAIFVGGMVGTSLHLTDLIDYWPFYQKRHYTNVAPDELAAAHSDASVLVFMEGARPDGSRYAGYWRYGDMYCVAPIAIDAAQVQSEEPPSSVVQYWAIGKNCCGVNQGFACDDAQNEFARSGLVMSTKKDDDTLLQGILSNNDMAYYEEAALMSMTKFDITSPPEHMMVRFVADITTARMAYWHAAWWSWARFQLIWLPAWIVCGTMAVIVGIGDTSDDSNYAAHIVDFKQSALLHLNKYI